jgi:hypothetical protein
MGALADFLIFARKFVNRSAPKSNLDNRFNQQCLVSATGG